MARYGVQLESRGGFDPALNPRLDLFQRFESYHRARGGAVWPAINEFCAMWSRGEIDALPSTRSPTRRCRPRPWTSGTAPGA
jgi:putative transposase